jgi:hypothetical protein
MEAQEEKQKVKRSHECNQMAAQLGLSEHQMRRIGLEHFKAMKDDARAYMLNLAHKKGRYKIGVHDNHSGDC